MLLRHALDSREVMLRVRTLEDVEAFRRLDLAGVAIDEGNTDLIARLGLRPWRPAIPAVIGRIADGERGRTRGHCEAGIACSRSTGTAVEAWSDLVRLVREAPGRALDFEVERAGAVLELAVTAGGGRGGRRRGSAASACGVAEAATGGVAMFGEVRYGVLEGLAQRGAADLGDQRAQPEDDRPHVHRRSVVEEPLRAGHDRRLCRPDRAARTELITSSSWP